MEDDKYSIAATETLYILKNTNEDDVRKIPTEFIDFLKSIANQNYEPKLDNSKTLDQMEIQEETKGILGAIYRNWWCSEEEKIYYNQLFKEEELKIQQEKRIKYNPNDIFKEKKQQVVKTEKRIEEINNSSNKMIEDKDNIFKKIINKIRAVFNKYLKE